MPTFIGLRKNESKVLLKRQYGVITRLNNVTVKIITVIAKPIDYAFSGVSFCTRIARKHRPSCVRIMGL